MYNIRALKTCLGFVTALILVMAYVAEAQPNWSNQGNWSPMIIAGDWDDYLWRGYGPVVADLDGDGQKEIIIADETSIRVYPYDAADDDADLFTIEPNLDGGYRITSIPSVGDINGDGIKDIVVCSEKDVSTRLHRGFDNAIDHWQQDSRVYVFSGEDGTEISSIALNTFRATTPALADIAVLNFQENPSYEE